MPEQPHERLSKRMAALGLCSRREADRYIEKGWVSVDGKIVDQLGSKVFPNQKIELLKNARENQANRVTFLLNKPIGYVSTQPEKGYREASELLIPENHWSNDPVRRPFSRTQLTDLGVAGRLDIDSTGLLVLTQEGRIARQIIGETSSVEKEYLVRVVGTLEEDALKRLNYGLFLDGKKLKKAQVEWSGKNRLRFILREGKKRQIRRMCELVGLQVTALQRIRIGNIKLDALPPGKWRYLTDYETF